MMVWDNASTPLTLVQIQTAENYLSKKYGLGVGIADTGGAMDDTDVNLGTDLDAFIVENMAGANNARIEADGDAFFNTLQAESTVDFEAYTDCGHFTSDADGTLACGVASVSSHEACSQDFVNNEWTTIVTDGTTVDCINLTDSSPDGPGCSQGSIPYVTTDDSSGQNACDSLLKADGSGGIVIGGALDHDGSTAGFFGTTPATQPTSLTTSLTTITHTAPGTPTYVIQDLTSTSPFGFVSKDEGNTVLSVVANLQERVNELESRLTDVGLLGTGQVGLMRGVKLQGVKIQM
jgi:hypothetical protein